MQEVEDEFVDKQQELTFQDAFKRKLAFFQARSKTDTPKSPMIHKDLWQEKKKKPPVPPKPSKLVAQQTVVLPNSTRLVISITDQEKTSSTEKIQELKEDAEIKIVDKTKDKVLQELEIEDFHYSDSSESEILSIKSLKEHEKPEIQAPKFHKEKVKISPLNLGTIEELSEDTSIPSPVELPKNLSIFDIFEKLDHLIDAEIIDLAKSRKKQFVNPSTELAQEITKNDEEFYDVLRGLVQNREKFFQDQENADGSLKNGMQNDKSTPTDKNSPDDNPLKISSIPKSKRSSVPEIIDIDSSPEKEYPVLSKRKRVVKVYKSVRRLEEEIDKQERLLARINRILDYLMEHHYENVENLVLGERHYLVAMTRIQSCLSEIERLKVKGYISHKSPYDKRGTVTISDIHLEIKSKYFSRRNDSENEFMVCLVKYHENVIATVPIQILDDVRVIRFPETMKFTNVFLDFEMRLEIFGTDFQTMRNSSRDSVLKKYGFFKFSSDDLGKRKFHLIDSVPAENSPLKGTIRMKVDSDITVPIHHAGILYVFCKNCWQKSWILLNGHIFKIWVGSKVIPKNGNFIIFDMRNMDADTVIPISADLYKTKFTFRMDFNHYVENEEFSLFMVAEDEKSYIKWTRKINQVISLLKSH